VKLGPTSFEPPALIVRDKVIGRHLHIVSIELYISIIISIDQTLASSIVSLVGRCLTVHDENLLGTLDACLRVVSTVLGNLGRGNLLGRFGAGDLAFVSCHVPILSWTSDKLFWN
jgi:hypothetical protein